MSYLSLWVKNVVQLPYWKENSAPFIMVWFGLLGLNASATSCNIEVILGHHEAVIMVKETGAPGENH